jgi:hypothetical protein
MRQIVRGGEDPEVGILFNGVPCSSDHGALANKQKCRGRKMRRREFIAGLGSAAAWPVVVQAPRTALPVIGSLNSASSDASTKIVRASAKD